MSYCHQCGSPKEKEETKYFSTQTGERESREICSARPCEHSGHDDETISMSVFLGDKVKCRRCGRITDAGGYW